MSERRRGEKEEKEEKEGRSWDEKWRRDPVDAAGWAAIFVWAGLVLLAENLGFLAGIRPVGRWFGFRWLSAWGLILAGAGVIVLVQVLVRLLVPAYRRPVIGTLIFGVILLGVGLGGMVGWGVIWALILIAVGVSVFLRGFLQGR
jgi:hypothetical protein